MGTKYNCKDHEGNEFESKTEMCKYWKVPYDTFYHRIVIGRTLEEALTAKHCKSKTHNCKDHLGNEFGSLKEMCKYWNISYSAFLQRSKKDWSLEKILTTSTKPNDKIKCKDHLGNEFESKNEMCRYWNIPEYLFYRREKDGWSLEKNLTTTALHNGTYCVDHLGNKFKSKTEMCKYWNIAHKVYLRRINRGWSVEDALTVSSGTVHNCRDHLGNEFKSINEMAKYWNAEYRIVQNRMRLGWSVEDALTKPVLKTISTLEDPITKEILSFMDICRKYNVPQTTLLYNLNKGTKIVRALKISFIIRNNYLKINQTKYNITVNKRIYRDKDVFECTIHNEDGSDSFRIMSYDKIDEYCLEQYKKLHNIS